MLALICLSPSRDQNPLSDQTPDMFQTGRLSWLFPSWIGTSGVFGCFGVGGIFLHIIWPPHV